MITLTVLSVIFFCVTVIFQYIIVTAMAYAFNEVKLETDRLHRKVDALSNFDKKFQKVLDQIE